jgi:hypothetical protein
MKTKNILPILLLVLFVTTPVLAQGENPPLTDSPAFNWLEISSALQTLITAILVPGAAFLTRWVFTRAELEKASLSLEQQYAFDLFLKTCVYAAEQMNLRGSISNKLNYALGLAEDWLTARGLPIDLDEIRAGIEAAVHKEFNTRRA